MNSCKGGEKQPRHDKIQEGGGVELQGTLYLNNTVLSTESRREISVEGQDKLCPTEVGYRLQISIIFPPLECKTYFVLEN